MTDSSPRRDVITSPWTGVSPRSTLAFHRRPPPHRPTPGRARLQLRAVALAEGREAELAVLRGKMTAGDPDLVAGGGVRRWSGPTRTSAKVWVRSTATGRPRARSRDLRRCPGAPASARQVGVTGRCFHDTEGSEQRARSSGGAAPRPAVVNFGAASRRFRRGEVANRSVDHRSRPGSSVQYDAVGTGRSALRLAIMPVAVLGSDHA
jgi:hypothetical protein